MIHIKDLQLTFGSQTVFDHISCAIDADARIGLVGRNGSGKSTLLKVIAKQQSVDGGAITILPGKRIAYMPQEVVLESQRSILEEAMHAVADVSAIKKEIDRLQAELEDGNTEDHIVNSFVQLHEQLVELEPEKLQIQAERILNGLGFKPEQLSQSVSTLSVGWKMRIVLAKLLLTKADFYLFDEPTNHLDIVAKDWFISFLKEASFGFLLVCHERYFLDMLCTSILALEHGKAKIYKGNYSTFEEQYARDQQELASAYQLQQKEIKRKQETIDRFKAKASKAKMAKSMQKKLDTIEVISLPPGPKTVHFNFPPVDRSGRLVLEVDHVAHTFGEKQLFKNVSFNIERSDRVALVAANGVGKTTLFNLIVKNLPLQQGTIEFGHNVKHAIFAQDQNESLNFDKNVFENARELCPKKSEQQIRAFLGAFLFDSESIKKKVRVLSGGEKNRLAMAIVLMQDSNFLLLDEPTNHLDMPSKEILLSALDQFEGTILFVSHDHDFINKLATRVIELTQQGAHNYIGNYESYLHQKKEAAPAVDNKQKVQKKDVPTAADTEKEMRMLEHKINKLEKELEQLHASFADVDYGSDSFARLEQKVLKKKEELDVCVKEWEGVNTLS